MIIILMGVSGSGKTTLGRRLARALDWPFYDGDSYHPPENVLRMAAGMPLTDEERRGWLEQLGALISRLSADDQSAVLACSALKEAYRQQLQQAGDDVHFVYLKGSYELIRTRLESRRGHFFDPALLDSQFEALEEPASAATIDVQQTPEEVIGDIRAALGV